MARFPSRRVGARGSSCGSGLAQNYLKQSLNFAGFTDVGLSSLLAVTKIVNLSSGNTYQFRTRARDRADNLSAWVTGLRFKLQVIQDHDTSTICYGGVWTAQPISTIYGGTTRYSTRVNDMATLTINGTRIAWVATIGPNRGKALVTLDGVTKTVDLYASTASQCKVVFLKSGFAEGVTHTLSIKVLLRNGASASNRVDLDGIIITQPIR